MRIVEITNEWDQPITVPHNGTMYTVPVKGSKIVPYDAAASLFGDPRARDTEKDKGRRETYDHVRGMWNFHLGWDTEKTWADEKCPKFSVVDVDTQEQIWFVIHDPTGEKAFNIPVDTSTSDPALIAQTLAALTDQVAALTARLAAQPDAPSSAVGPVVVDANELDNVDGATPVGAELPPTPADEPKVGKDGPRTPPTGRSK